MGYVLMWISRTLHRRKPGIESRPRGGIGSLSGFHLQRCGSA